MLTAGVSLGYMHFDAMAVLRSRFPGVLVQTDRGPSRDTFGDVWDVFGVDAGVLPLMRAFVRDELRPQCREEGVSPPAVIVHSIEETREYYPDVFERWFSERWQAAATQIAGYCASVFDLPDVVWASVAEGADPADSDPHPIHLAQAA